jgi:hypothetical protein
MRFKTCYTHMHLVAGKVLEAFPAGDPLAPLL